MTELDFRVPEYFFQQPTFSVMSTQAPGAFAAPIPASTQDYLRPWQNPELVIDPQGHAHKIVFGRRIMGYVCAGPNAFGMLQGLVGEETLPTRPVESTQTVHLLIWVPACAATRGNTFSMYLSLGYTEFEQEMDAMDLDSVTAPGFFPYWVEKFTGICPTRPNGREDFRQLVNALTN